jgi:Cu+-exporting ATPase
VRGAGEAADLGIIMRTGEAFQTFRQVRRIVLDKTGTLTKGQPTVQEVVPIAEGTSGEEVLSLAASAESLSQHPLARAMVEAAKQRGLAVVEPEDFQSVTGFGVEASVGSREVLVGRPEFLIARGLPKTAFQQVVQGLEERGQTVALVAVDGSVLGAVGLGDDPRPEALEAVGALRERGMSPLLVTGDNESAARSVAERVGIDEVHAGVLPDAKARIVRELQADGTRVAMVGDGINDAPALMQADVGVAMGSGTDIAVESADVIVLRDDLNSVTTAHRISRSSYRRVRQNVSLAFLFNGIGIPLAATGLVYPVWAMIAMAVSVTTIFINSLGRRPSLLVQAIGSVGRSQNGLSGRGEDG